MAAVQKNERIAKPIWKRIQLVKYYDRLTETEFNSLDFSDFERRANLIQEIIKEEHRLRLIENAFCAFLLGAAPGKTFPEMLKRFGLIDEIKLTKEELKEKAKQNYEKSRKIIAMDRGETNGRRKRAI